jgi:signal transduction histidine kinase
VNFMRRFRRHLGWKIFVSYLVVILVLIIVMVSAAIFVAPSAFDRHLTAMEQMTAGDTSSTGEIPDLEADLFENFRVATNESLRLATIAAFIAAVTVSIFVSRRIVAPIHNMMNASQRIADGHYDERVDLPGADMEGETDELGQLALSFNQMAERLQHTEEMRRQLIGDVAHELRTPLTTIQGSMEGLIDGVLPADEETYQNVYREATRLQKLVHDLQELSRVEAGVVMIEPQPVKMSDLTKTVCAQLERQYLEKGVELINDVGEDLRLVMADEDRIGQVLLNLLGNGLQYTPSGGRVRITARNIEGFIETSIEDTGIGIDPDDIPFIFTRFFRVDKSRSRVGGGSGIGLTIAKHLIEASGGRIWVRSPGSGKGSTFTFTLPAVK